MHKYIKIDWSSLTIAKLIILIISYEVVFRVATALKKIFIKCYCLTNKLIFVSSPKEFKWILSKLVFDKQLH